MAEKVEDLRTFAAVSCGDINDAEEMGIAKSPVGGCLSDLEARLGITLMERNSRPFETIAVERNHLRRARDLMEALERLKPDLAARTARKTGCIFSAHDHLTHLVAPTLPDFLSQHPNISLRLVGEGSDAGLSIATTAAHGGEAREIAISALTRTPPSPTHLPHRRPRRTSGDHARQDVIVYVH